MPSLKSSSLGIAAAYIPLENEQFDELEEAEILTLLQSSDADSSSDDDSVDKTISQDPTSGDSSVWKAAINLVNFIEGIGFLAVPYALKEGGIAAIVAFIITPVILWYTGTIVIECLYDEDEHGNKHRVRSGYKDLGDVLLPKYGGYIVSGLIQLDLYMVSVSFLVLFGSVMRHVLPSVPITEPMWIGIAGGLVLPTMFLKSLSQIASLSATSVVALLTVVVCVVWHGAENTDDWDLSTILFWDTEGVITSLPIIVASYAADLIIPSVEESMTDKTKFGKALSLAFVLCASMKLFFAVFAFLSFGSNTDEVILNSLPSGLVHITVGSFFALNCAFSYVLIIYPVMDTVHKSVTTRILNNKIPESVKDAVIRVTVVISSVVVATLVPSFLVIISFIGSIFHTPFGFIFPIALHLKLKYDSLKIHHVFVGCFIAMFGVVIMVLGILEAIKTIITFHEQ